jgi:chromosome segregation ATPase
MGATLTLSVLEIILLFFGAITLGITIHFTLTSRRSLKDSMNEKDELNKFRDEWKSRYFNDIEIKEKDAQLLKDQLTGMKNQLESVKEQLMEAEENTTIYSIEAEEMRKENKQLQAEMAAMQTGQRIIPADETKIDYLEQLRVTQNSLLEHNEKINQLLGNIDLFAEKEERQREILRSNEELVQQVSELKAMVMEKEKEIHGIKQKEHLTKEMTSMLDNAYNEFNVLQSKMQKLELQVSSSKMINMDYEDMKESFHKVSREFEQQKQKLHTTTSDNQNLHARLMEVEEKLREANFQRQQLQKRVAYLEELNGDMQAVTDANKKLEGQLKRIGELESMLHVVAEERDQLIKTRK